MSSEGKGAVSWGRDTDDDVEQAKATLDHKLEHSRGTNEDYSRSTSKLGKEGLLAVGHEERIPRRSGGCWSEVDGLPSGSRCSSEEK